MVEKEIRSRMSPRALSYEPERAAGAVAKRDAMWDVMISADSLGRRHKVTRKRISRVQM